MRIIHSKRKTLALIVTAEGELVVRAPLKTTRRQIDELVQRKAGWIAEKQALAYQLAEEARPPSYQPGETFWYLGRLYPLTIMPAARPTLTLSAGCFRLARTALPKAAEVFQRWYRRRAAEHFTERVTMLAAEHGFTVTKVRISSARSRWGSCSGRGTLSFTWRLIMAPPEVIDYVVVHELAHLREHNHGPRFWALVTSLYPDYSQQIAWLKQNGHRLV